MKIVKEFVKRNVAGQAILVPVGDTTEEFNGMITLTESAEFIWDHLEKVNSLDEMIEIILKEYDVDKNVARRDVVGFTGELIRHGIVKYTREDRSW